MIISASVAFVNYFLMTMLLFAAQKTRIATDKSRRIRMNKKEQMLAMRNGGALYREIASVFGVSRQYVSLICGKSNPRRFIPIGDNCVFPNLRKWMNRNRVSRGELLRRTGLEMHTNNYSRFNSIMRGEIQPRKDYIDRMLKVTGMSYEELFRQTEADDESK
jgi:transcriptional regulator with XRE-family HTH domain